MRIGMIGLGALGSGIAASMVAKGHDLFGFDTDAERLTAFSGDGGLACGGIDQVASSSEIVFSCLPSVAASEDVARQLVHAPNVRRYVELSTLGRNAVEGIAGRMAAAGIGFLDCPVSGSTHAAREGRLSAVMAGPADMVEAARPVVEAFTQRIFVVGETPGLAQVVKIINNILSVTAFVASCEAISLGVKAGADMDALLDFINVSTGRNSATADKFPRAILPGTYDYGGPMNVGIKDVGLFQSLAQEMKVPTVMGSTVANLFTILSREMEPGADYSRIYQVFEQWADIPADRRT